MRLDYEFGLLVFKLKTGTGKNHGDISSYYFIIYMCKCNAEIRSKNQKLMG